MTEQGRWTKPAGDHGDDPSEIDAERRDPQRARVEAETRPVVNDQKPTGAQGITSDRPGVDPGGYPEERALEETAEDDHD